LILTACGAGDGSRVDSSLNTDGDQEITIDGDESEDPIKEDGDEESSHYTVLHDFEDGTETKNSIDNVEYALITTEALIPAFEVLAKWKNQKGIPTKIFTMEYISENYPGVDAAEELRNFLIDLYKNGTLTWVLLGGDTPLVPHREFWSETDVFGFADFSGNIASEMYFADLDGTWDDDNDGMWGEYEDNLDLKAEINVTRVPVDDREEAEIFVAKVMDYEQHPPENFINTALFISESTGFYGIDSSLGLDPMDNELFPDRFDIRKLYWDPTPYPDAEPNSETLQKDAFGNGPNLYVHFGHGGGSDISYLGRDEVQSLENSPRNGVFISTACYSGGFHDSEKCGGDSFVTNPNGGGVAYLGNTDTGIDFPSGMDYIYEFYKILFNKGKDLHVKLGDVYTLARERFTTDKQRYQDLHPDRWTIMSLVMFGDPEMPIWVDEPRLVKVSHPDELSIGKNRFNVKVTWRSHPLEKATVTIYKENEYSYSALTDENGEVDFRIIPHNKGTSSITVTGFQVLPYHADISILSE